MFNSPDKLRIFEPGLNNYYLSGYPALPPEVSVILPFYNASTTLERSLDSLQSQTFKNFECLLVNNNSTDRSVDIARKYCSSDTRFVLLHEQKQGVVHAHNLGMNASKGKYLARMDADDWCFPDRLMKQYTFLEMHKEYGVVAGRAKYMPHKPETEGFERYVKWSNSILDYQDILLKQYVESPIINPTAMWRKEVAVRHGSYRDDDFPEDYELWLRWLERGVKIHKLADNLICWYDSDKRLTRIDDRYRDEAFINIKSQYLATRLSIINPLHPDVWVWGASKISRSRAMLLEKYGIKISGYIDISLRRQLTKEVIHYSKIPSPGEMFILVYLKEEKMRHTTMKYLANKGFIEGKHYLLAS